MSLGTSFPVRLVVAMELEDLTVARLHEALDGVVSTRTLWRWRSGRAAPGVEVLPILARALKTTPHALLGWEDA